MKRLFLVASLMSGCSNVGPGFANHPVDCAMGIAWADCLPGTKGYDNGGGQVHREAEKNAQVEKQQKNIKDISNAIQQMPN
ncbi:hypothetical protein G6727_02820 [Polynucleobacter paneuropaeus]|nr:hypothetical protein [Polynucleobacter paneuropaeus]